MTNANKTLGMKYADLVSQNQRKTLDSRLISKSVKNTKTGCLEYKGNNDHNGYGKIKVNGRQLGAHRVSYVVFVEDVPPGMVVMHKCDNPCCINPDHLRLGTQKENIVDCIWKGRFKSSISNLYKNRSKLKGEYSRPICVYNDEISFIYRNPVMAIADGFNRGGIYQVLNGKRKTKCIP